MPTLKGLLFICIAFLSMAVRGQSQNLSNKLIGKWLLVRHDLLDSGKVKNKISSQEFIYEFSKDLTYTYSCKDPQYGNTMTKGQWKVSAKGDKVHLYNNIDVPHDPHVNIMDHDLPIIKLTNKEFVTHEYLFSEAPVGKSFYEKQ